MRRLLTWFGLLATLALLVAACGTDDDALSDTAYFDALEGVIAEAADRGADLFTAFGEATDEAEASATFLEAEQAIFEDARASVSALNAPSDLAEAHGAYVDALGGAIAAIEESRVAGSTLEAFFDDAAEALDAFGRACDTLQQAAVDRDIAVDLVCGNE